MANNLLVGVQNSPDGTFGYGRAGKQGDTMASKLHGDMYEQAYRGSMFHVSNQASVTTTAGLATTWTGLGIQNPAASGVNLVIRTFSVAQALAATTASAIGLMCAAAGTFTGLTVRNAKIGQAASVTTTASASATIATPILDRVFGSVGTGAVTVPLLQPMISFDLQGSLIIPPGFLVATYSTGVISGVFTLVWEEVPI